MPVVSVGVVTDAQNSKDKFFIVSDSRIIAAADHAAVKP
jgi:hypothetical protein